MAIIKLEAELETEEYISNPILTNVLKIAIEKVFFVDVKIRKLIIERIEDENPAIQTGTDKD